MPDRREDLVRKMIAEGTSDDDIRATLKVFDAQPPPAAAPARTWGDTALDVGTGIVKGAASTVAGLGSLAGSFPTGNVSAPTVRDAVDQLYGQPGLSRAAFTAADEATTATNTPQMVGKGLETAAEFAVPVAKAVQAIPRTGRAIAKFADVAKVANQIPVNLEAPGNVALRIADIAQRGGGSNFGPAPVRQFIQWATDPKKAPMTYEVARDFAKNISKLSSKEMLALPDAMKYQIHELRVVLNKAVGEAAAKAGKGQEYAEAMNEFAKAKKLQRALVEGAKYAAGAMGAGWVANQLIGGK